jgi:alpha-N-arabinofuranosidase
MKTDRREFLSRFARGAAALPLIGSMASNSLSTAADSGPSRIRIGLDRPTHTIDRKIYGIFAEHLGRCIYEGVYQENSPLSDADGYRKDVREALKRLNVPTIRWPGGFFATYYHWLDGVGPKPSRPQKLNVPWKQTESNRFGTDEFIVYCRQLQAEPQIVVNCLNGTVEEALGWLEYCNLSTDTHYANLRRKHGHERPFGVKYWELDNEVWAFYSPNERGATDYADRAWMFGRAMKHIDPSIKLTACGLAQPAWDRPMLERLSPIIDYVAIHQYVGESPDRYREVLGTSRTFQHMIQRTRQVIKEVLAEQKLNKEIGIAFNEYNIVRDWSSGAGPGDHRFELSFNLRDALWLATVLNLFQRNADVVKFANYSELVNVVAPIRTNDAGMFCQTVYYTLQLYSRHCGSRLLETHVDTETFATSIEPADVGDKAVPSKSEPMPYLDVSATRGDSGLSLIVTNLHAQRAMTSRIEIRGLAGTKKAIVYEINGPSMDTENSFQEPNNVTLERKSDLALKATFEYSFPPHSITLIKAAL